MNSQYPLFCLDLLLDKTIFLLNCSCLAGECVHFYEDVHELDKIPEHDTVRRIYMARDIIDTYIIAGIFSNWIILSAAAGIHDIPCDDPVNDIKVQKSIM